MDSLRCTDDKWRMPSVGPVQRRPARPRVLIVDDDPLIRSVVRAVLEDARYELTEASDGREALHLARQDPPNVVLLDVMMPGMNGYEVAESLRREIGESPIIIMLTARDRESDKAKAFSSGANAFFSKPFSPLDLLEAVSSATHA